MSARRLVIDCATPALSVALFEGEQCLAAHHHELGRGHAEALLPAIAALPDGGRADEILVDVGPGSFTGVRVGLAGALALGFAWQARVRGYGCLDLVAAMVRDRFKPASDFPVVMVGGHGELFWALYPADAATAPATVRSMPIAELASTLDHPAVYGSGAAILVEARGGLGDAVALLPDARCIDLLPDALRALQPRPNYGRGADAKPMADRARPRLAAAVRAPMSDLKITAHDDPGEPDIANAMAVMGIAFDQRFGEAWSAQQLRSMMAMPGSVLVIGQRDEKPVGFGLLRAIAGEAELLLLAVDPAERGQGHGRRILDRCLMVAERSGAESVFLEVRDSNPAVHLYSKAGFNQYNRRKDYYLGNEGCRYDALSFKAILVRN